MPDVGEPPHLYGESLMAALLAGPYLVWLLGRSNTRTP
ncbi:hypothetical protein [Azospirillum argentinense]